MGNSNFGIGALHVKRQILTYFCEVISLFAQVLLLHLIGYIYTNRCLHKNIENFL